MGHDSEVSAKKVGIGGNKRRVGLLGGTFDPPHLGHLVLADQVRWSRNLDEVWFLVANDPWQKSDVRAVTSATDRLEMVRAALQGHAGLTACDAEIRLGGSSYTSETLRYLRAQHPTTHFEVIVGSDAAAGLRTWNEPEWLAHHAEFVAVGRGGQAGVAPPEFNVHSAEMPMLEISSTDLRRRFASGEPVRFLVPDAVCNVVKSRGLYSSTL